MHTHNEILVRAPAEACLAAAADVELWPEILSHYRWVRFHRRDGFGQGRVEMAAYRRFGPVPWPVWWVSEMHTDFAAKEVRYRHVDGITRGMDVAWRIEPQGDATRIVVVHDWDGPAWPGIGGVAARRVIGPHFIRVVAGRTLEGIRSHVEGRTTSPPTVEVEPGGNAEAAEVAAGGSEVAAAEEGRRG